MLIPTDDKLRRRRSFNVGRVLVLDIP